MKLTFDQVARRAKKLVRDGDVSQAVTLYQEFIDAFPKNGRARKALAELTSNGEKSPRSLQQRLDEVVSLYQKGQVQQSYVKASALIEESAELALAWNIRGASAFRMGMLEIAENSLRKAIDLKPDFSGALSNLGTLYFHQGKMDAACEILAEAIKVNPNDAEAYNTLGGVLYKLGRLDAAEKYFVQAVKANPKYAEAYNNLGTVLFDRGRLPAAQQGFAFAAKMKANYWSALSQKLYIQAILCDWAGIDEFERSADRIGIQGQAIEPFTMLSYEDDPKHQMHRSQAYARTNFHKPPQPVFGKPREKTAKLKIGYFSADFHNHATVSLMMGLFKHHDRSRFEIHAFSYGQVQQGQTRDRLSGLVDSFENVFGVSDEEMVERARQKDLDIAIELKGYTRQGRTAVFAYKLAPIQMNYVGYPGTLGTDFIDYVVADEVVIPKEYKDYYTEKVIYLPDSYQPNDNCREIADTVTTRADFGLPEDGFVFCCFNGNYKITPREFDIWMRLLNKVEGSVLWLFHSNDWAVKNLRGEAMARGVDPDRLVFAQRLREKEHLARHKHADLFLDTFNVNAHTTASDALWAGLPVITKPGKQFAARVAASLLHAVGMTELVAKSDEDYESIALDLALNPEKLAKVRRKLSDNRSTHPLFDSERYTRHLEAAYTRAYDLYREGKAAEDIQVK
ncbi:tetratricopeptide repeat protein [Thalassospira xiamenensis]|uniref:O-linked N-acetylglucosamine transferase, SPINDLY family protein n=1 Tax=Thalassospira xiamenensis TaxID=220697 RepID=UPI0015F06C92|nr:tetratricopeptide repeat protein [Thalassospira xiamenensis]